MRANTVARVGVRVDRPRHRDRLALAARHQCYRGIEFWQVDLEAVEHRRGFPVHRAAVQKPKPSGEPRGEGNLAATVEVLCRRQIVEKREVLVHRLDAGAAGSAR